MPRGKAQAGNISARAFKRRRWRHKRGRQGPEGRWWWAEAGTPGAAAYRPEDEMEVDRGGGDDTIASLMHWNATEQRLSTEIVERAFLR